MNRRILILTPLLLACGPFFYQAPPPLERYPHRVPGKTWERLLQESKPPREDAASGAETLRLAMKLGEVLPLLPVERRQVKIDEMIGANREGRFSARAATLLLELKEIAGSEKLDEAERYLEWRLQAVERKPLLPPVKRWDQDDDDFRRDEARYRREVVEEEAWLEAGRLGTPPFLQPNYEVQRAARLLLSRRFDEALRAFRDLLQAAPDHPRAEVACFMIGRCLLDQSRALAKQQMKEEDLMVLLKDLRAKAEAAFKDYLRSYPQGRFVADTHGWLGGLAADEGRWGDAVARQMERLAVRDSREVLASVLRECDWLFAAMFNDPAAATDPETLAHSLPCPAIAKQPQVVRLFVFQALDPATREKFSDVENFSSDERTVNFLSDRITRPQEFAKRSLNLLGAAIASAGGSDSLSMTVLGWSALRSGENAQALAIFGKALLKDRSDELLQGHAAALAAVGRHAEAARAYAELGRDYPESQLAGTVEFDAAMARFHAGEAGEALLQLIPLTRRAWDRSAPPLHAEFEPIQWIDTIAQFAPIEQLAKPLASGELGGTSEDLLRAIVRYRALAAGKFDLAKQYLDSPGDPSATENEDQVLATASLQWRKFVPMDQSRWDREVQPLVVLEAKLAASPDDAALHLEAGKLWQSLRGKVTMPIHRFFDFSNSEPDKLDLLRRRNAAFIGIPASEATAALDSRDELNRALSHFLQAAEHSKDPAIAAPALELANEALFRLAEFSRYHATRALESHHAELSAKLVARLKQDFPDRPEAARAIAWTFPDPATLKRWMPGSGPEWLVTNRMAADVTGRLPDSEADSIEFYSILARIKTLAGQEFDRMAAIRVALSELQESFTRARPEFDQDRILALVDHLDDLSSVAAAPEITPDLFRRYVTMRMKGDPAPPALGEWAPLRPWLDFYDLARPAVDENGAKRPHNTGIELWEAYQRDFPDSPKLEAAALRVLRAKVKGACPIPLVKYSYFPDAPLLRGYSQFERKPQPGAEDLEQLRQAISVHQQRFPNGRYQADVLMLRATVGMAGPQPEEGLKDLATILGDRMHPELHVDAAQQLAWFGMRLLDPEQRLDVAAALRKSPEVMPYLRNLANGRSFLIRLKQFLPWVEER